MQQTGNSKTNVNQSLPANKKQLVSGIMIKSREMGGRRKRR